MTFLALVQFCNLYLLESEVLQYVLYLTLIVYRYLKLYFESVTLLHYVLYCTCMYSLADNKSMNCMRCEPGLCWGNMGLGGHLWAWGVQ